MKKIYFTPGPSQLFPTVQQHLQTATQENIPSISHRGKQFQEIFSSTTTNLKKLLNISNDYHIFFVSSGTEAMERTIENTVQKRSFHFINGNFSKRFFTMAKELGKETEKYEVEMGQGFTICTNQTVKRFGTGYKPLPATEDIELICLTQNETSTGVALPVEFINQIANENPDKLIAIDIVSSAPYIDLDYSKLDVIFFSVQKGFGMPAGLGVMIVSPRAFEKTKYLSEKGISIGSYHNFLSMEKFALKNQTAETPNVLGIYLLGKVCEDMLKIGIVQIRKETEEKAKLLYDFLEGSKNLESFVKDKEWQSQTVIVANVKKGSMEVVENLKKQGLIVGSGYGKLKDKQIRIANFPAHSMNDVKRLIDNL